MGLIGVPTKLFLDGREFGGRAYEFSDFLAAFLAGLPSLRLGHIKQMEIRQHNLKGEWVSMVVFDLAKAEKWLTEYEETLQRERTR